jgi:hypothetical protein
MIITVLFEDPDDNGSMLLEGKAVSEALVVTVALFNDDDDVVVEGKTVVEDLDEITETGSLQSPRLNPQLQSLTFGTFGRGTVEIQQVN